MHQKFTGSLLERREKQMYFFIFYFYRKIHSLSIIYTNFYQRFTPFFNRNRNVHEKQSVKLFEECLTNFTFYAGRTG